MAVNSQYEALAELRDAIKPDLINHSDIPNTVVTDNTIYLRDKANSGYVFDYPSRPYLETKEAFADYADIIENVLSEYVNVERKEITHRTDGKTDTHYWVIRSSF